MGFTRQATVLLCKKKKRAIAITCNIAVLQLGLHDSESTYQFYLDNDITLYFNKEQSARKTIVCLLYRLLLRI